MITTLKLTNFQRHEDLTVNFTSNLNAIRGLNEAGKSSLMRAIAYAFFGSRALPVALEDTVTWGKPAASLKVELTFVHGGKTFTITRKKSGAELVGDGVVASGQAEVTAFVENLFGASAAVAQATMVANQSSLQNGLDSSAMPLIEKLANMSLIDELIGKIQTKLPSGNTKGVEAQLQAVSDVQKPVADTAELEAEGARLAAELSKLEPVVDAAVAELALVKINYDKFFEKKTHNVAAQNKRDMCRDQISDLQMALLVPSHTPVDTTGYKEKLQLQKDYLKRKIAFNKFKALPASAFAYNTDRLNFDVENCRTELAELTAELGKANTDKAVALASIIKETACGLCGKDLSEVPEVVEKNRAIHEKVSELELTIDAVQKQIEAVEAHAAIYKAAIDHTAKLRRLLPIEFTEVDESTVPPTVTWVGGEIGEQDFTNYDKLIREAEDADAHHGMLVQQALYANDRIHELEKTVNSLTLLEYSSDEIYASEEYESLLGRLKQLQMNSAGLSNQLQVHTSKLDTAKAVFAEQQKHYEGSLANKARLEKLLSDYHLHNGIISKLREARPAVAAKLWALVLTGVSHYFSQIRGTSSTVTRGEKGFLIDGKSVESFSGSTKDSLGLAIRLMLQKTFLPNVNFMLVDEPGAAFDDTRESDMLAVLAGAGLDQVILVTHSDLADTFAANVVQI
jgi:DNA repair exonuclease SbcCD ATPase subunit